MNSSEEAMTSEIKEWLEGCTPCNRNLYVARVSRAYLELFDKYAQVEKVLQKVIDGLDNIIAQYEELWHRKYQGDL